MCQNMKLLEMQTEAFCALQTFNCNGLQGFFQRYKQPCKVGRKIVSGKSGWVSNVFFFFHSIFCQKMPTQMARVLKMIFPTSLKVNFSFIGKNLVWKALCPTVWRNRWNEKSWRNCWVISWKWIRIWQLLVRKIWQLYKQSYTTSKSSASCPAMVPNAFQPLSV